MKSFFKTFFASLLAVVVVLAVIAGFAYQKISKKPKIEDHSYLVVDVYGEVLEYNPPEGALSSVFGSKPETLQRILTNLEKVTVDDRIDGVIMKLSASNSAGIAMYEEMRGAIKKVRDAGKPVYAFTDNLDYRILYLASACDSIFMPNGGFAFVKGLGIVSTHYKGTLEKLGIKANIHKIKDYKAAAELVTRENMSPEARENREWMLDEIWEMMVQALTEDRGLTEDKVIEVMEHALFTPDEAKEYGVIDEVAYWQELEKRWKLEKEDKLRTVSQSRYAQEDPEDLGFKGKKKIAVVHAQGTIGGRQNRIDPVWGVMMGHESVVSALRQARFDDDVAAIVFRVDSRGGEGLASDMIAHEVEVTSHVKPIVASMVDVAASGGYYVSYTATKIVADPTTITGSIGSISGKFNMTGFWNKLGVTHDTLTKGPMALLLSDTRDFTDEERKRFEENHWDGYNSWVDDVARHRGIAREKMDELGQGRVWSGRQAAQNKLIDEVGGLDRAIEMAKELADIPTDQKVTLVHYPKEKGLVDILFGGGSVNAAVRWAVYRFIKDDVQANWQRMSASPMYMMEETVK